MGRVVLLALLGVPILVVIHAAGGLFSPLDRSGLGLSSQTHWQSPTIPSFYVVEQTVDSGA
jgi:hypothetical protein